MLYGGVYPFTFLIYNGVDLLRFLDAPPRLNPLRLDGFAE